MPADLHLKPETPPPAQSILIIKLGAFGDFVQALAAMRAVRQTYPDAHMTLLTRRPYRGLGEASGYFQEILLDDRPAYWNPAALLRFRKKLTARRYDLVVDLQTSDRSGAYRFLFLPHIPAWSGIAPLCSHPQRNPNRNAMHTLDRQADQLAWLGIKETPPPDLSFLPNASGEDPIEGFDPPGPVALLAPGAAPHRVDKRWPAERYGALAAALAARGFTPAVIGTRAEQAEADAILKACPQTISLIDKSPILLLGALAARASIAIGNDTGPMHLLAAAGCPSVVVYSDASDPARCAQRGPSVEILRRPSLADLPVEPVLEAALSRARSDAPGDGAAETGASA
ncbi:MAG: glycosyltransferase family 9 protein [Alphaproteobacteria bacterium]|nr:glycosyltransferase family 9 protein [Alphaproteobacteria bacterium]